MVSERFESDLDMTLIRLDPNLSPLYKLFIYTTNVHFQHKLCSSHAKSAAIEALESTTDELLAKDAR